MPDYKVVWELDVFDVDSPREAAAVALNLQQDPTSIATVFDVIDQVTEERVQIDLLLPRNRRNNDDQPSL